MLGLIVVASLAVEQGLWGAWLQLLWCMDLFVEFNCIFKILICLVSALHSKQLDGNIGTLLQGPASKQRPWEFMGITN